MFVDRAIVNFVSGMGGNGCMSFRREKFIPKGGPNGGDGGDGGDIILVSQTGNNSLIYFKYSNIIRSKHGENGKGGNKTGKKGKDEILFVPVGTVVKTFPDEKLMFDFSADKMRFVIAKGGQGGWGNTHFKSSVNQSPRIAIKGKPGEEIKVILELKLIAFAGLVGFPNAGKSTLISKISEAKPKIADYPFTTLSPNLGVVYEGYGSLVVADIPGIIEGAHKGDGMGLDFLKHIERNKVLVFLIDISDCTKTTPYETFKILRDELKSYKTNLLNKKYFVVGNKKDLVTEMHKKEVDKLREYCNKKNIAYVEISALNKDNLSVFKKKLFEFYNEK